MDALRALAVCVVVPGEHDGARRAFFVAKGRVVCVRPFHGPHGLEWQAGLAAVARAEPDLSPEAADELIAIAVVPAPAASRARGPAAREHRARCRPGLSLSMEELRARARATAGASSSSTVWRRRPSRSGGALRSSWSTAPRTETVPPRRVAGAPRRARSRMRGTSTCSRLTAMCTPAARRSGRWLVSHGRPSSTDVATGDQHDRDAATIRCRRSIRSSRRRGSRRDKERQVQHYVELLRTLPLWDRERIRVVDAGCGKAYMSLALVAYGREVGTRVELVGLDANVGVVETVRGHRRRSSGTTRHGSRRRRSRRTRPTARSTCSSRCTRATPQPTRRSQPEFASGQRRSSWRRAATTSSPARSRQREGRRCSGTDCCSARQADLVTDALRAAALETLGYRVDVIEFVATEHTPKNVMLRAERAPSASRAARAPARLRRAPRPLAASIRAIERLLRR